MGNINKAFTCLLLIGSAASTFLSFNVQAEGNGVIVLNRDVQPIPIGRSAFGKDPYPTTVNANPSARIDQAMTNTELSDGDFASIASGSSIRGNISVDNSMPGMNVLTNPNGLPGMSAGHGGGGGGTISNTINRSLSTGLAPLTRMAGGQ
ncbi:hypothetical protein DXT77_00360 [Pseudomonas sp. 91RF]|uniref:hypothetical protein n=1 Tax=unclassified Pseudomonas TaxID=196821 RepID=UPI000E66CEA3|nr:MULTISPECIES: hypothetical protein [unclassified Pseudomonas]MCX2546383.1 hypothetical protein [Pseudomonas sp. COW5]RIJ13383.1 hypothetical protein DXT77_00360 [Pseudomonas sp. 91RF]